MKTPKISFLKHEYVDVEVSNSDQIQIKLVSQNIVSGAFSVNKALIDELKLKRVHKAIVISLTSGLYSETHNLIGGALTFLDDLVYSGDMVVGYFTMRLDTLFNMNLDNIAFVTMSFGDVLSNTIVINDKKNSD